MDKSALKQRLAAILCADAAGYFQRGRNATPLSMLKAVFG